MLIKPAPRNVSEQHFELSQIADYIAWKWGCRCIGNEVSGCTGKDPFGKKRLPKTCIDAIGIKSGWFHSYNDQAPKITVYGFEAKVSLSDFRAGFCTACEYTYVIAPIGIIPVREVPQNIGLIEVDLAHYEVFQKKNKPLMTSGIKVVQRSKRSIANFSSPNWTPEEAEKYYRIWTLNMMISIARRQTINGLFYNSLIRIGGDSS